MNFLENFENVNNGIRIRKSKLNILPLPKLILDKAALGDEKKWNRIRYAIRLLLLVSFVTLEFACYNFRMIIYVNI